MRKRKLETPPEDYATSLERQCRELRLPLPAAEVRFHPTRKWKFDFCWPLSKVALEIEGAVWVAGRHTRGSGFIKDMEKYSEAAILGWCVIRSTPSELLKEGVAIDRVNRALVYRGIFAS